MLKVDLCVFSTKDREMPFSLIKGEKIKLVIISLNQA
jgi:hypothetical protein